MNPSTPKMASIAAMLLACQDAGPRDTGSLRRSVPPDIKDIGTHATAIERTEHAMRTRWAGDPGRQNQGRQFINKAKRSDKKRKAEKASRKRNRR